MIMLLLCNKLIKINIQFCGLANMPQTYTDKTCLKIRNEQEQKTTLLIIYAELVHTVY